MSNYLRPQITPEVFRDAAGNTIDYGNRWHDGPPDDSYSIDEHTERFRPLHRIANALIEHLAATHEVTVESGAHLIANLAEPPAADEIAQAVLLTPRRNGSSSLLFVFTNYPGIQLYAGAFFSGAYPICGCNACDEIWQTQAEELERDTLAIVSGGLTERVNGPIAPEVTEDADGRITIVMSLSLISSITAIDGLSCGSSESNAENVPRATIDHYRATLDRLASVSPDGNWLAWPRVVRSD